jgi:hypothetical protein
MTDAKPYQKCANDEWRWNLKVFPGGRSEDGVRIEGNALLWFTDGYPGWAYGHAVNQSFESLQNDGPQLEDIPAGALTELKQALREQGKIDKEKS